MAASATVMIDTTENMIRWTHDAFNRGHIASVGHRRWMLNPFATYMSYGQVFGNAAQKVQGFDEELDVVPDVGVDYVAWPFETYPALFLADDPPWSFSVIEDKSDPWGNRYPYFEEASISVVRAADGESLTITDRSPKELGGLMNVLSWQVEGWEYDTLYEVEISDVTLQSGDTRDYSYTVFIDRRAGAGL